MVSPDSEFTSETMNPFRNFDRTPWTSGRIAMPLPIHDELEVSAETYLFSSDRLSSFFLRRRFSFCAYIHAVRNYMIINNGWVGIWEEADVNFLYVDLEKKVTKPPADFVMSVR
jgi:hypothetical protein